MAFIDNTNSGWNPSGLDPSIITEFLGRKLDSHNASPHSGMHMSTSNPSGKPEGVIDVEGRGGGGRREGGGGGKGEAAVNCDGQAS